MRLFFLSLLFCCSAYSQSSGIVTYRFYLPMEVDHIKEGDSKVFISKLIGVANSQEFELSFNRTMSSFKCLDKLNLDSEYDRKVNNIAKSAYTSADTYIDFVTKISIVMMNDGTLIKSNIESEKWEIKNETKTIGTYLCYKAVAYESFINRKGEPKTREIIGWFAPALPYSFGPKTFNGLPGLILELTEDNKTFTASKIELSDKEMAITFPKGKTTSKEEYEKKLKEGLGAIIKSRN